MASFFEWDAKYDLGVPAMDDEHRLIVDAMNQLHDLHTAKELGPRLLKVMQRLVHVTRSHFADEEAYMDRMGYPELRKHRHMHAQLLERLDQFEMEMRKSGVATEDLFNFLKMWLKAHICGIDTQYAKYSKVA
jgi:hemerythrin-like metal-binding protein